MDPLKCAFFKYFSHPRLCGNLGRYKKNVDGDHSFRGQSPKTILIAKPNLLRDAMIAQIGGQTTTPKQGGSISCCHDGVFFDCHLHSMGFRWRYDLFGDTSNIIFTDKPGHPFFEWFLRGNQVNLHPLQPAFGLSGGQVPFRFPLLKFSVEQV